jgi:hypothetical protein
VEITQDDPPPRRLGSRTLAAVATFGVLVFCVYLANGRGVAGGDVDPAALLPIALWRGDGFFLDRFHPVFGARGERSHGVAFSRGHLVSRYPLAPALVAFPVTAVQMTALDLLRPGWDLQHASFFGVLMAKNSHAFLVACAAALLLLLCLKLGASWPVALLSAFAGAFGSTLWSVAAQGAWQHGVAVLGFAAASCLLWDGAASRGRLLLAGFAVATMVASRPLNVVFAIAVAAWVVRSNGRQAWPFFLLPMVIGAALLGHNLWFFGTLAGGQTQLEALHPRFHGVTGTWSGNLLWGGFGTLFSPSRGLFIFSPWALFGLAVLPFIGLRSLPSLVKWLLPALGLYALALAKYSCWWAGWSFGPRFWTDTIPILVVIFCLSLQRTLRSNKLLLIPAVATVLIATAIHALGAYAYPSSWNASPRNVDIAHERLWDWRDTELTRSLREGPHEPQLWEWPAAVRLLRRSAGPRLAATSG